jgi:hypothetical protein
VLASIDDFMRELTVRRLIVIAVVMSVPFFSPAAAQAQDSFWGVSASFTPTWKTPDQFKVAFQADGIDLKGSEFRAGIVRGRTLGGDWGISFVRKSLAGGSVVNKDGGLYQFGDRVVLTGGTIERFGVFGTIKDRVQIGMLMGIGAARIEGTVTRNGSDVPAAEALAPLDQNIKFSPLARLELGLGLIVAEGFKLRVSGGLNYPGYTTFSVGGVFLFER